MYGIRIRPICKTIRYFLWKYQPNILGNILEKNPIIASPIRLTKTYHDIV